MDSLHHTTHLIYPPPRESLPRSPSLIQSIPSKNLNQYTARLYVQTNTSSVTRPRALLPRSIGRPLIVPHSLKPTTKSLTKTFVFGHIHNSFLHSYFLYQYSLLICKVSFFHCVIILQITFPAQRVLVPPFAVSVSFLISPELTSVFVLFSLCLSAFFPFSFIFVLYIKVTARRTLLSLIPLPFCLLRCVSKQFHIYLSVYLFFYFVARIEGIRRNKKKI
ncbi:hypothetical protein BDV36DRAFT_117198 [Aspergillus pseudocaelatus]|uniref:Uncharacterized protein n=1 Tax=Aspergillus pseudocaelatus TaxID=1825620 RepID=A0ABQ6W1T3_9EURO|nr:hypothetical protein BDV36DRAFT_117198 [Aspergillus pseudocaelatus]